MKKILVAGGVAALIYYFFFYKQSSAAVAGAKPLNGAGTLNNPVNRPTVGGITLGPSFSQKVPGVASVS